MTSFFDLVMSALWIVLLSAMFAAVLVNTRHWHQRFSADAHIGIQKIHLQPTPRIGGIAIVGSLTLAYCYRSLPLNFDALGLLAIILLAGIPAFLCGLIEDLTKRVGVLYRLLGTMISGIIAYQLSDHSLHHLGVIGLDNLLEITLFSVIITAFAVAGLANAINILDGLNGLASLSSTLILAGYALMAYSTGDLALAQITLYVAASVLGLFVINWPWGKIFLGDGGAYFIGFALGWIAVMLLGRNPSLSPFAILLACFYPVAETLFSMWRRLKRRLPMSHPDRLHLHSLLNRRVIAYYLPQQSKTMQNSVAGGLLALTNLLPILCAYIVRESTLGALLGLALMSSLYYSLYRFVMR